MNEKLQEVLSAVVESKVTRAEVVELALTSLREKLVEQIADKEARLSAIDDTLSLPAALQIVRPLDAGRVEITVRSRRKYNARISEYEPDGHDLVISARLEPGFPFPKAYAVAQAKRQELEGEIKEDKRQLAQLSGAGLRARSALIRMALDASPNGAKVLAAIDALRGEVHAQIAAPTARALPRGE